jgi:hypothetical protein
MHVKLSRLSVAAVLALAGAAASAAPTVIDFDPQPTVLFDGTNSYFDEGAFRVTAVWYAPVGAGSWTSVGGHFHTGPVSGSSGNTENQHFNGGDQLQGLVVTRIDGQAFSLSSLDYLVTGTTSINGFSSTAVQVLLGADFSAAGAVASATSSLAATMDGAFHTLAPGGFSSMTSLFISSSASMAFDNIVLDAPAGVPEPGSFALAGLALLGLGLSRKRSSAA